MHALMMISMVRVTPCLYHHLISPLFHILGRVNIFLLFSCLSLLLYSSQVRSVDQQTKLLCIIALSNLLDETTVEYMLDEVHACMYASIIFALSNQQH